MTSCTQYKLDFSPNFGFIVITTHTMKNITAYHIIDSPSLCNICTARRYGFDLWFSNGHPSNIYSLEKTSPFYHFNCLLYHLLHILSIGDLVIETKTVDSALSFKHCQKCPL